MAVVSLQSLIPNDSQLLQCPSVIEGLFKLHPMGTPQGTTSDDDAPAVGVSVSLCQEQQQSTSTTENQVL